MHMKTTDQLKAEYRELEARKASILHEIGQAAQREAALELGAVSAPVKAANGFSIVQATAKPVKAAPVKEKPARARKIPEEIQVWVADKSARRLPLFVIKATGLETKKQIVERYGEDARFEVGHPLPDQRPLAQA